MDGTNDDRQSGSGQSDNVLSNEARLQLALEAGGLGLWEVNLATRMLHGSSAVPLSSGSPGQLTYHLDEFLELVSREHRSDVMTALERAVSDRVTTTVEYQITRPDGETRWIEAQAYPVLSSDGTVERLIGITRDITSVRTAEAEREQLLKDMQQARMDAERSVRQRDSFISSTVHDLRTPLTYTRGRAQLLQRKIERSDIAPDDQQWLNDGLMQVINGVQHIADMLVDLQDVVFLQLGQPLELRQVHLNLVEFVETITGEFAQQYPSHEIDLVASEPEISAEIDPIRMRRVLSNILLNAIKYSEAGTVISVRIEIEPGIAVISVQDKGIGIPEAERDAIFERYRRGSNTTSRHEGSGIGLAGARVIARQHGGDLTVESRLGVGSTFSIRLPRSLTA